ncbi:MAG: SDR family NAD(P)-dependent oxidoreductase [Gemmatimonadota bacterium]|nr:SDR family NAD(P)-dependent oxidoreductase [Gemmatimonadota bacterium]
MTSHSPALSGRSAVVTGASRGIGAGIAAALGAQGVRVVMLARNEAKLKEQSHRIPESIPLACDVTDPRSIDRAAKQITRQLGAAPDILVNNAGLFRVSLVEATTTESFVEMIETNLVAPFVLVRTFLEEMKRRKSGHIVTLGSIADRTVFTGNAAYSAAKYGLRALHEVMRAELRGSGVRTTLISPAATDTDIWKEVTVTDPAGAPHSERPMLAVQDVVAAVMFGLLQPEKVNIDELRLSRS